MPTPHSHAGDVTDLPFDDDSFDVAHCHAVLMHIPDTEAVLAEVKRVLKPGGLIASREFILSSSFLEPGRGKTQPAWDTFGRLLAANGGHPEMGTQLKRAFLDAGFTDIRATGSFDYFGGAADVAFLHAFILDWFYSPNVVAAATKFGLATQEQFDAWRQGIDEWKSDPGAVGGPGLRRSHRHEAVTPQPHPSTPGTGWQPPSMAATASRFSTAATRPVEPTASRPASAPTTPALAA